MSYCILSFARVIFIDASAAQQVKTAVQKAARHGCKLLFCRMNEQVFSELWVAGATHTVAQPSTYTLKRQIRACETCFGPNARKATSLAPKFATKSIVMFL